MIEVVQEFCYLGNVVGNSGNVQSALMARIHAGWRKFSKLKYYVGELCHCFLYKSCIKCDELWI